MAAAVLLRRTQSLFVFSQVSDHVSMRRKPLCRGLTMYDNTTADALAKRRTFWLAYTAFLLVLSSGLVIYAYAD
jgi:hypothetical protein